MYLYLQYGSLFKICCKRRNYKLYRLYEIGFERVEKEMDIVKLLRGLRNLKIFSKMIGLEEHTKFAIKNSNKNVIDLDNNSDEVLEDSNESSEE